MDILAEAEIRSLLLRERHYKDTCQWEKLRACYHPDASKTRLNISWHVGTIDEFIAGAQRLSASGMVHVLTPVCIDVRNNQKALAESLCEISVRYAQDGVEYDGRSLVRGITRLERVTPQGSETPGPWKMLTMEVIYVRDSVQPVAPPGLDMSKARTEGVRSSYRYLTWHVELHGGKVMDNMPGEDDPKSVEAVVSRNQKWIDEV